MPASPTLTVDLYPQDTTLPGNKLTELTLSSRVEFVEGERQEGNGRITLPAGTTQASSAASDAPRTVRITAASGASSHAFEFIVTSITRDTSDEQGGMVTLAGPGTRRALSAGLVLPYGNCLPTSRTTQRILGYQDPSFDISGLPFVQSFGPWRGQQTGNYFGDPAIRAEGMTDPFAAFIANTTGAAQVGEVLYFSPTFTVATTGSYIMQVSADDEYDSFLVGSKIGSSRGKYQWKQVDDYLVELCTGVSYRWVLRGNNLSTDLDGTTGNINWVIGTIVADSGDGTPAAGNEIWHLATDAEGGSFTIRPIMSSGTATILYNDTSSVVQSKLEALPNVGAGNVTVSGAGTSAKNDAYDFWYDPTVTGGTFTITVDGEVATITYGDPAATIASKVEALITVTDVTVTGTGTSADKFRMEFVGVDAQTDFSVSFNGSGLTGGGLNHTQVSNGSIYDPYVVEFVGTLAAANIGDPVRDGSGLVGGTLDYVRAQPGSSAAGSSVIRTSTAWTYIAYPPTPRGLTPGHMIRIVVQEAQARGATILDLLTLDFTDLVDSNGDPWTTEYELAVTPYNTSVEDVVAFLEMSGLKVRMAPGYVLEVAQTTGFDRRATVNLSGARLGIGTQFTVDKEIANVLYSETTDKGYTGKGDGPSIATHGRWEIPYSAPDGPEVTVGSWQTLALNDSRQPYKEHTLVTAPEADDDMALFDYFWGDGIVGQDVNGDAADCYVSAVGLRRLDDNAAVEYTTVVVEGDVSGLPLPGA